MKLVTRTRLIAGIAWTLAAGSAQAQAPLFPDKGLEAAVREVVIEKKGTDKPLTEQDVANLSTVSGKGKGIKDLTGLDKCKKLASLDLADNQIVDVKPLQDLKMLQLLDLGKNKIKDVKPLSGLTDLQYLDLSNNDLDDITPLKPLTRLTTLYLTNNRLADARTAGEMKRLWSLYLDGNKLTDIAFVSDLKSLSTLAVSGNAVANLAPLLNLTELKYLFLENNKVSDLSVLIAMAQKDQKEQRFAPYWQVYLTGNPLSAAAKTAQLAKLRTFGGQVVFAGAPAAPAKSAKTPPKGKPKKK